MIAPVHDYPPVRSRRVIRQEPDPCAQQPAPAAGGCPGPERRGQERFVHLINYSGDRRETGPPQVQELPTVHGIRVRLRLESAPVRLTSVPDGSGLAFRHQDQQVTFEALPLSIHAVYRVEL